MLKKSFRILLVSSSFYMALFATQKIVSSEPNHKLLEESLGKHLHVVSQEDLYLGPFNHEVHKNKQINI